MNFYVPDARLDAKADMLLRLIEEFLASRGRAFTGRRIRALIWDDGEEEEEMILVGAEFRDCEAGEDPVLLILEDAADAALMYAVSLSQVAYGEMPNVVRLDPLWRVVDFDDG
jgi:hypothetical protein